MQKNKENIWNIPNLLTLLRIFLIPLYLYLILRCNNFLAAAAVFVTASCTDLLDGYIARRFNLITDFGKLIDPLADKLLVIGVLVSLIIKGIVPLYILLIIVAKEFVMVLGGIFMYRKGIVVYSKTIGKIAQAVLVAALLLSLLSNLYEVLMCSAGVLLFCSVVLTIVALVFYINCATKQLHAAKQNTLP